MDNKYRYTDDTLMPFGKFKGIKLGKVPTWYLLWLLKQPWIVEHPKLLEYCKIAESEE